MTGQELSLRPRDEHMTFETFVPSPENSPALQMAILMAEIGCCSQEAPLLYVHGELGVGKTHLLSAITDGAHSLSALFVDTTDLRDQWLEADSQGWSVDLKDYLIDADILVLDNVHASQGYDAFQKTLCKVLELRIAAKLGVVISANVPPQAIKTPDEACSRLLGSAAVVKLHWGNELFRVEVLQSRVPPALLPPALVRGLAAQSLTNGHAVDALIQGLKAGPEMRQLLAALGYSIYSVRQTEVDGKRFLITRWRADLQGRTHVVEAAYSYTTKRVLTRCWSYL